MATVDFTPVQDLLGREVCFRDLDFEIQFKKYSVNYKDLDLKSALYRERFKFGLVSGCGVDLDQGKPSYTILVDEEYYSLSELELLFVSSELP